MQTISIEANQHVEELVEWFNKRLNITETNPIDIDILYMKESLNLAKIICSSKVDESSGKPSYSHSTLKVYVSGVLADFILRAYEEKIIARIINTNYCYFNASEKKEILNFASDYIRNDKNIFNSLSHIRRRNIITAKLLEYFDFSDNIILDGFINFRLKEYRKELEEIVDKAVDDFLMEREYKEFINLLKYFVEIQQPKLNIVHIVNRYDGRYILLNEKKKEITNECVREFLSEVTDGEINYDDLLVSSLITLAPNKVIIHVESMFRNKELLETIKHVFGNRLTFCEGCDLCSLSTAIKREN